MSRQVIVHVHRSRDASSASKLIDDLATRMAAALEELMGWSKTKDAFVEAQHPRAPDGRFGNKAGEHGDADLSQPKPTSAKGINAKSRLRELLESEHPFTKQELMAIAGITNESTFTSWLSMLRNPKYAGKAGVLEVVKNKDGTYQARPKGATPPAPPPGPAKPPTAAPAPIPAPAPKPAQPRAPSKVPATTESAEVLWKRYILESDAAGRLSWGAKTTAQHNKALRAHAKAAVTLEQLAAAGRTDNLQSRREFHALGISRALNRIETIKEHEAKAKATLPANEDELSKKIEARYMTMSPDAIDQDMKSRFGLGLMHKLKYAAVRGVKVIDLDANTAKARDQRRMLGHVYAAMESLEAKGFDIKGALRGKSVQYIPANPQARNNGVAWQQQISFNGDKVGLFCVSASNRLGVNTQNHENHMQRMSMGQARWSRSSATLGNAATRTTIVHEFVHALGMQDSVNSPALLEEKLHGMMPSFVERKAWIKANISEYATANIRETDAELGAMVTEPGYKRGTLPSILEDHVDQLFNRRRS